MGGWLAFLPVVAWAQGAPSGPLPQRLYVDPDVLLSSPRVVSLGGAYVGVAEGADGMSSNLAAVGQRNPTLDRSWDVDATLSWLNIQLGNPQRFDFDNAGSANGAKATSQFAGALLLQVGRLGLGTDFRLSNYAYCTTDCAPADQISVQFTRAALAAALALHHDDFIVAAAFYSVEADFGFQGQTWRYAGSGLEVDALYRPAGEPFRLGLSIKPQVVGAYGSSASAWSLAGRQIYTAIVSPSTVSLGVSYRLGEGARFYNRISPQTRHEAGADARLPEAPPEGAPTGRWLLTGQLDLIQAADNAVSFRALINASSATVAAGDSLQPRLGVEHETIHDRLRTRLGGYLEPSAYSGINPRPHLTGGAQVLLIRYLEDWSLSASFDVARLYYNVGLSLGFWR
jgi:hypothetical protein